MFFLFSQGNLWQLLDTSVHESRGVSNAFAEANIEVDRYLAEGNIAREEDPLAYWSHSKAAYPFLYKLVKQFLCSPASSVPCERVFSKAGEILSKRRNRLSPKVLDSILFLNKNR